MVLGFRPITSHTPDRRGTSQPKSPPSASPDRRVAATQAAAVAVSAKPSLAAYGEGANIFGAKTANSGEATASCIIPLACWCPSG